MANSILLYEDVSQLLQEAGCTDEFTQQFLVVMETENIKNLLHLLCGQRSYQLERLHEEEKKLDLSDFDDGNAVDTYLLWCNVQS